MLEKTLKNLKETKEERNMLKNKNGITLIALVVTIVVLLLLAGVSINLVLDNNGIIAKSKDAKASTRASQVEDEIGIWEQNNFINSETGQEQEDMDNLLASLISRKLLTEDEIDRERGIITIKKSDGTIIKEISYSNVKINISREPETTEKVGAVVFTVDSVEGITSFRNGEEYNAFVNALSEEQQKEIIRRAEHLCINKLSMEKNTQIQCTTFKEALEWHKERGDISAATEEEFWNWIESMDGIIVYLAGDLEYIGTIEDNKGLVCCVITNPDNEVSNTYRTCQNGIYTFKVQDIITGRTYIKRVEVNNIDKDIVEPENIGDWEYTEEDDGTITITSYKGTDTTVIIPNYINNKPVKKITGNSSNTLWNASICNAGSNSGPIGVYTKKQDTIEEVIISEGIEVIDSFTFTSTLKLKKVTIPETVTTIERSAFAHCTNLSNVIIPNSVTTIGTYAFYGCDSLQNIDISSNVTSMGSAVFNGISSITVNVPFKEGELPDSWEEDWNKSGNFESDITPTVNYKQ